jgi:hypothetical protein
MMAQGLQNLINFRDDLQQEMPEPTGLDKLSLLQNLTMNSMAENAADNQLMVTPQQYFASGGLVSLPVVQAGFGGFLKKITSIPKKVFKAVKRVAKSPFGKLAITAAPALFGGLPMVFANPAANAAFWSGGTTLLTGGKPEDALKSAILSGGLVGLTSPTGLKTPEGAKGIFSGKNVLSQQGIAEAAKTGAGSYSQMGLEQLAQGGLQPQYAVGNVGTGLISGVPSAPSIGSVGAKNITGGLDLSGSYQDFTGGRPPEFAVQDVVADQAALKSAQPTGIIDTIKDVGGSAIGKVGEAIKTGYDKFSALSLPKKALIGGGALLGLSALGAGQQIPQQQLDMAGLTPVETDFDKQIFTYRDMQGNILDRDQALQMIQTASQSFGEGGEKVASGVTYGFDRVDDDKVLSASGGLIGMAYGGQTPMNNLDVKYKEFSGMVGGQGDGMEDNVYMPIVERDNGQQVATLAVSPKEYVVDANTMSLLGNGNPDAGAKIMDQTVKDVRMAATGQTEQQKEIDGLEALNRMRRSV